MYGSEHGFLLHTGLMIAGWVAYIAMCVAPLAIALGAYWLGVRRGRRMERNRLENEGAKPVPSNAD